MPIKFVSNLPIKCPVNLFFVWFNLYVVVSDVLTYQGSIHLQGFPLTNSLEESLLQWRALNTVQEAIGLVEHLATVTMTNIVFTPQVKINGHSNRYCTIKIKYC